MRSRYTTAWLFNLILPLAVLLAPSLPLGALEVPFDNGTTVDSNTNRGFSTQMADIDGDGDLDLLSAVSTSNTASWWRNNNGLGTSWTETVIATGIDASSVYPGDVDGDGDMDVLVAIFTGSDIVVYRNDDGIGGTWSILNVETLSHGPRLAIFADMDRDGDLDVVVAANSPGTKDVAWYPNTAGDGSAWGTAVVLDTTMNGAAGLAVADMDADGDPDVVAAGEFENKVSFYANTNGLGTTWTEFQIGTGDFGAGSSVTIADIDGDGKPDVAASIENDSDVLWWSRATETGTSWNAAHVVSQDVPGAYGIAAGDLDFDGDIDLVSAGRVLGARADWWENTSGDGSTWAQRLIESGIGNARSPAIGDINGDGWLDVAVNTDTRLEWWRNESIHRTSPFLQTRQVDLAANGAFHLKAADLDRDGDMDLVGAANSADTVVAYRNSSGDGTTFTTANVATGFDGARAIDVGDIDRDGKIDVVGVAEGAGDLVWWRNADGIGTSFTSTNVDLALLQAKAVKLADIDSDGDLDIAAASAGGDELAFYRNANGDGSVWNKITALSFFVEAGGVDVGDFDGDGDLDIVGSAFGDDDIAWAENTVGDGSAWSEHTIANTFDGASAVAVVDIDTDGDPDVVAVAELADTVSVFVNTAGNGSAWTEQIISSTVDGARGVAVADLDQDGDFDVVATESNGSGRVVAFDNANGIGTSWSSLDIDTTFGGAALVSVADVDLDGRPDVLAGAATDGDFLWWRNGGGQAALPTTNTSPSALGNNITDDLLRIEVRNNGKVGEANAELANLELRFEDNNSNPLTSAQANGIIENLLLFLDTGNGVWDGTPTDTLLQTDGTLALTSGVHTMTLVDADTNYSVAVGTSKTYFVVAQTTATYTSQAISFFRMIHLTESTSRVEDRNNDTPLRLEYQANVSSNLLQVNPSSSLCDLQVQSLSDSADPVIAGNQLSYSVTIFNAGPDAAENVSVTGTLPGGVSLVSTTGCENDPSGSPTCNLGTIAASATKSYTVVVAVDSATTGTLTYSINATTTIPDTNGTNNADSETTLVNRSANLALDLIDQPPGTYADGFLHHYTIVITNPGPSDTSSSLVNDTFPGVLTGVVWTCTATAGSSCTSSGSGNLVNSPVSLKAGGSATFRIRGNVPDGSTASFSNTATVTDPNDPSASNNSDSVTTIWGNPIFVDGFETGTIANWI